MLPGDLLLPSELSGRELLLPYNKRKSHGSVAQRFASTVFSLPLDIVGSHKVLPMSAAAHHSSVSAMSIDSSSRILITGGTGSFGKAFIAETLRRFPTIERLIVYSRYEV